jgi:uncharacterized caspase-like protein
LVIGIDGYHEPKFPVLQYAERDAIAVAEALPALGFPKKNIRLMLASRGEVSRERTLDVLGLDLNEQMGEDDRLVVYFAGHGVSLQVNSETFGFLLWFLSQKCD